MNCAPPETCQISHTSSQACHALHRCFKSPGHHIILELSEVVTMLGRPQHAQRALTSELESDLDPKTVMSKQSGLSVAGLLQAQCGRRGGYRYQNRTKSTLG